MKTRLAIDVGSAYVKVMEGGVRGRDLVIRKIGVFPNPFADVRDGLVEREQDVLVRTIRAFLRQNRIGSRTCAASISGHDTIIHYFDIPPNLPEDEIRSTVGLELMQVTPGGIQNLEYDYLLLPKQESGQPVLFIGYPKEKCSFFVGALQASGLKPLVLDHDALAIINAFRFLNRNNKNADPVERETLFLLDVGDYNTDFALAEEPDGFILVRNIPFGGRQITETIAQARGISPEDAQIYQGKPENSGEIKEIIQNDLADLLAEATAGVAYFKTRTGKSPANLLLTGGGALIPGMCEAFRQTLDIDTRIWNPLQELPADFGIPGEIKQSGTRFAVSLGLLLRQTT